MPFNIGTLLLILLLIIILITIIIIYKINVFSNNIIYPERDSYEDIIADLKLRLNYTDEKFKNLLETPYEEFNLTSNYGYKIYGRFFKNKTNEKCVILLHREGRNLMASYKFLEMYLNQGYNVVMFDSRYHGNSGGNNYTYGFFERWDLKTVTDYVFDKLGSKALVGTHGESGGAATSVINLKIDKRIGFCISDTSFTDLIEVLRIVQKKYLRIDSKKILLIINQIIKRKAGFALVSVSPLTEIEALEVPTLFIHSELDEIIPLKMSKILKNFKLGYSDLFIAENSTHLLGYYEHKKLYEDKVIAFTQKMEELYSKYGRTYI